MDGKFIEHHINIILLQLPCTYKSTPALAILDKIAAPDVLICIFVDIGLLLSDFVRVPAHNVKYRYW